MLGPPRQAYGNGRPINHGPPVGPPALQFLRPTRAVCNYTLSGVTRDNTGAVLGGCTVDLFYATGDKQRYASMVSDPTTGAYTFVSGDNVSTFFVVSYKDGGTPVGGTSLQTLKFT